MAKKLKLFKLSLHWQILIALLLSVLISLAFIVTHSQESGLAQAVIAVCDFFGELFLNALKMIVVPLIMSSIICGMVGIGGQKHFGRMGLKTLSYYFLSTLVSVLIGLGVANIMQPGTVGPELAQRMIRMSTQEASYTAQMAQGHSTGFVDIFIRMVPTNIIGAASDNGQILGVICFSLLFGFFVANLPRHYRHFQSDLWQSILRVMMMIADLIIMFAPLGAFALVTPKIIGTGFDLMIPAAKFFASTLLALGIHFFGVLPAVLYFLGKVNPIDHYRAMTPAMLTAFSTASSISTLPVAMDCVERGAGVSNRVTSFTLPLGATINMNGTALYECMVVIFIAQFYAVVNPAFSMTLADQFMVVVMAALTSVGVAGIPSGSLVAIAVILGAVGLPLEYMGIILVVDRLLDMCRSTVNIMSDTVATVVIARSEGEEPVYTRSRNFFP